MNARLPHLEKLLTRVRKNAERPRSVAASKEARPASAAPQASDLVAARPPRGIPPARTTEELELDEPTLSEPPPSRGLVPDDVLDLDAEDIDIEEAPPESGPGLVGAAKTIEEAIKKEPRRPPITPPPESGEEPAPAVNIPRHKGPTMEQLGNTIHLDESGATDFELDEVTRAATPTERNDEYLAADIQLTSRRPADQLELPANAREELDRVRLGQTTQVRPAAVDRPAISTNVVEFVSAAREFSPLTFVDLLDASLAL